ncbi:MAG: tyrosine-type recombinase/integrase [Alphaproteobacteria bacterium]|nr:tyrosine-type recombinase/integrase [Alphaproteobacteria bacterium]
MVEHTRSRALAPSRQRLSRAGRSFDPASNRWVLRKERTVRFEAVFELLDPNLHESYRSVLEYYARHRSAALCAGIHEQTKAYLRATRAGGFDEDGLRNYRRQLSRRDLYKLGTIRGSLKRWHLMGYSGISEDAVAYLSRIRLPKNETGAAVKSLDPEKGPFEDNELRAVIDATVSAFERSEIKLDIFAFMMLLCHTGQRPEQLTLLRTCDIDSKESAPERTSYIVPVPRGKQRGERPRQSFDDVPVTSHLQVILERQKAEVIKRVEALLGALPRALDQDLPLFPAWRMLTSVTGAEDLRDKLSNDELHVRVGTMQYRASKIVVRFARTGKRMKINFRRFRYTTGTRAARAGAGVLVIAQILGHKDTQSAGIYTADHADFASRLDVTVGPLLERIASAFTGTLVDHEGLARNGHEPLNRIGEGTAIAGTCGRHARCTTLARACYTCPLFQPWLDGPHREMLARFKSDYQRAIDASVSEEVVSGLERSIIAAIEVIARCDERNAELSEASDG